MIAHENFLTTKYFQTTVFTLYMYNPNSANHIILFLMCDINDSDT